MKSFIGPSQCGVVFHSQSYCMRNTLNTKIDITCPTFLFIVAAPNWWNFLCIQEEKQPLNPIKFWPYGHAFDFNLKNHSM